MATHFLPKELAHGPGESTSAAGSAPFGSGLLFGMLPNGMTASRLTGRRTLESTRKLTVTHGRSPPP